MERKNKIVFSLLIILVMMAAMFYSFGLNLFASGESEIVLPSPSLSGTPTDGENPADGGNFLPVLVTRENVQDVIATLNRPENYYRAITLEVSTGENKMGNTYAQVWVDGGLTRVELSRAFQPMGTQYTIVVFDRSAGEGTLYRWYGNDNTVKSWSVGENAPDLAQHIPTYEDILDLDQEHIMDAGFVEWNGTSCIYVETAMDELGYLERYWVSVDNGLLVGAETVKGDQTVLRMSVSKTTLLQQEVNATLPDGTVLQAP